MSPRLRRSLLTCLAATSLTLGLAALAPATADACGCFSPPIPDPASSDAYAVNQQSEQIVFEQLGMNQVRAHVLVRYAGDPESFAWIVPVPAVPDLDVTPAELFAFLEAQTAPIVGTSTDSICPPALFDCDYRDRPVCPRPAVYDATSNSDAYTTATSGNGSADTTATTTSTGNTPGVTIVKQEVVADYEAVVFAADEASLAVEWLQTNGFVVNDTTTPYMMPYVEAGMYFVAVRLVAGADTDSIQPLEMTFTTDGPQVPMVPLRLTAVAAEPHLTVTSYVFGEHFVVPDDQPMTEVTADDIAHWNGRTNYPMALARVIDEAGGDAFVHEYLNEAAQIAPYPPQNNLSGCCGGVADFCGIADDGLCQCLGDEFDRADCAADPQFESTLLAIDEIQRLRTEHRRVTRITTRLSAAEMTFDPMFVPDQTLEATGRLGLTGEMASLGRCYRDVVEDDVDAYWTIDSQQACASTYCDQGTCGVTREGNAGCMCDTGYTARTFLDLDGQRSVTCVPQEAPVDIGLNLLVPNVCAGVDCGEGGVCLDVGGEPTCRCPDKHVAMFRTGELSCEPLHVSANDPGGRDYTEPLRDLDVCHPDQSEFHCGIDGWVVAAQFTSRSQWVECHARPVDELFVAKPDLVCANGVLLEKDTGDVWDPATEGNAPGIRLPKNPPDGTSSRDDESGECGCTSVIGTSNAPTGPLAALAALVGLGWLWRRRR